MYPQTVLDAYNVLLFHQKEHPVKQENNNVIKQASFYQQHKTQGHSGGQGHGGKQRNQEDSDSQDGGAVDDKLSN